jgi:energy-coupling factor transporter ATP-binding protein EcfA2
MATIDDVVQWAGTLPGWQGDAVRRILEAGDQPLTADDYSEIMELAKADLGLAPQHATLKHRAPEAGKFSGVPGTTAAVKLLSLEDVQNVNIIKSGQSQPFSENGLTVVYGNNGSGKSGYSRILKLACQARDKDERILPNVFSTAPAGTPTATLKIKHEAAVKSIKWTSGVTPDQLLTNITVFDSRCARIITDDRNEISYLPYGADVFHKTVEVIQKVKAALIEKILIPPAIQDSAIAVGTASANLLESLSETTSDAAILTATTWTAEDKAALSNRLGLAQTADSSKSLQEISRLNKIKGRVNAAIANCTTLVNHTCVLTNEAISLAVAELHAAELAHAAALAEKKTPEPLPGVASTNQWAILYEAAKRYSEEVAYPHEPFPKTEDAVCVLCQQELSPQAAARFTRFKKYIEDETNKVLEEKRNAIKSLREVLEQLHPWSGSTLDSICDEVSAHSVASSDALRSFHSATLARKSELLKAFVEGTPPEGILKMPAWPVSPADALQQVAEALGQKVSEITVASKPHEYKALVAEIVELQARRALAARKADVDAFVARARRNAELRAAAATLRTQEITRQGTAVIKRNLTPELIAAVRTELRVLGATRVPLSVKPSGSAGEKATHEFQLEGAKALGSTRVSEVLSEGEARVIAIAGFLAELKLAPHANAIVLDDPVSSLDHVFTRKIAERLAHEGLIRQVIIFTHNIAFLMELQDACAALAKGGKPVAITVHTLSRSGTASGITMDGAPWHCMKVKHRVQHLDEQVSKIKPLYQDNMVEYNERTARIYGLLREAWEASVEDDLLDSVVSRYRNSVQTLRLEEVDIEDADISQIDLHMSKASTWMTGHDKSKSLHDDRPSPDEVLADIQALRAFSKAISSRRESTKKRRKDKLQKGTVESAPLS